MKLNELFEKYRKNPCEGNLSAVLSESQYLIYGIVIKITYQKQDAEDITQEVLIKVIQNINFIENENNYIGWLSRVALNAGIDYYRHKKRNKALLSNYQETQKEQAVENQDETINIIYQHLSKLDSVEQSLVINKHIHQMTLAQLSSMYKLPISTIKLKIDNTLKKLKVSLEKTGFAGVALAVVSTLDQLKPHEVTLDLLPKIKAHYPSTYPKVKPDFFSSKILLKVLVPIVAVLIAYFTIDHLITSNQKVDKSDTVLSQVAKQGNSKVIEEAKMEANDQNQANSPNETRAPENNAEANHIAKNSLQIPITQDKSKPAQESEFAGQLIDAETKKPIADAKLEIWDIYTYKKIETRTDEDGKYFTPKDIDKTFFFFLKFTKEGYVAKQTFQHFEIHSKILIYMRTGKKENYDIIFDKPSTGTFYIGSHFILDSESYLSSNQKINLQEVSNFMRLNAPIEVCTIAKVEVINESKATLEATLMSAPESKTRYTSFNFGVWYENSYCRFDHLSFSTPITGNKFFTLGRWSNKNCKLIMKNTGKSMVYENLKIIDYKTKQEITLNENDSNKLKNENEISESAIVHNCIFKIEDKEYRGQFEQQNSQGYSNNVWLCPYTLISFETTLKDRKFENAQVLYRDNFFSQKSTFNKSKWNTGKFVICDKFFEEEILRTLGSFPLGGIFDVNEILNSTENRMVKITITLGEKPLTDTSLMTYLDEKDVFDEAIFVELNSQGIGFIKTPLNSKKLKVVFRGEKFEYSKIVDLEKISNDNINIIFNKKLDIQISQEIKDSYRNAYAKNVGKLDRKGMFSVVDEDRITITNESTNITIAFSATSVFVEKEEEYVVSDCGYSINTNFNRLKAIKPVLVKSHIDSVTIKPASNIDYTIFQFNAYDETESELKKVKWYIFEDCHENDVYMRYAYPAIEFLDKDDEEFENYFVGSYSGNKPPSGKRLAKDVTIGEEAIENKTLQLLNNRKYILFILKDGFVNFQESFYTKEDAKIYKKIILHKPNSVIYSAINEKELVEITKLLKSGDIIYEYNEVRIVNKESFAKAQQECKQEKIVIKLIRNNKPLSLIIPAYQINGLANYFYDDKDGLLKK